MQAVVKNRTLQIPTKFYRVGELTRYTPFSRQTIHNYTIMGLISEAQWTEGGHRLYDESVFERLSKIIQLKKTKTLTEIKHILSKEQTAAKVTLDGQTSGLAEETTESSDSVKPTKKGSRLTPDRN
jgi:DNA-binding transcriptional MerR regulator